MRLHRTVYVQRERSGLAEGIKFGVGCVVFALALVGGMILLAMVGAR